LEDVSEPRFMQGSRGIFWLAEASEWMLLETRPCRMAESPALPGRSWLEEGRGLHWPKTVHNFGSCQILCIVNLTKS
jgi:hypothetical protein